MQYFNKVTVYCLVDESRKGVFSLASLSEINEKIKFEIIFFLLWDQLDKKGFFLLVRDNLTTSADLVDQTIY